MRRLLGYLFLIGGVIVAILDLMATEERGMLSLRPVGDYWFRLHSDSLQLAQPAIERHVTPFLWDPVILTVLQWPLALVLIGIAALLLVVPKLLRRRR